MALFWTSIEPHMGVEPLTKYTPIQSGAHAVYHVFHVNPHGTRRIEHWIKSPYGRWGCYADFSGLMDENALRVAAVLDFPSAESLNVRKLDKSLMARLEKILVEHNAMDDPVQAMTVVKLVGLEEQ